MYVRTYCTPHRKLPNIDSCAESAAFGIRSNVMRVMNHNSICSILCQLSEPPIHEPERLPQTSPTLPGWGVVACYRIRERSEGRAALPMNVPYDACEMGVNFADISLVRGWTGLSLRSADWALHSRNIRAFSSLYRESTEHCKCSVDLPIPIISCTVLVTVTGCRIPRFLRSHRNWTAIRTESVLLSCGL